MAKTGSVLSVLSVLSGVEGSKDRRDRRIEGIEGSKGSKDRRDRRIETCLTKCMHMKKFCLYILVSLLCITACNKEWTKELYVKEVSFVKSGVVKVYAKYR